VIEPSAEIAKVRATAPGWLRSTWRSGVAGMLPSRRWRSNSGDSCMPERAMRITSASAAPTKNGMRQPQPSSCAGVSIATVTAEIATASSAPTSLAAEASEVTSPRRRAGALSSR